MEAYLSVLLSDGAAEGVVDVGQGDDDVLVPRREAGGVRRRVDDERALDAVSVLRGI